jgi:hypothetical protein
MDDEDDGNISYVKGWTGDISHYSTGTNFEFCKVDGNQFHGHASGTYAVLKLSTDCPAGSFTIHRSFHNENRHNNNRSSENTYPNISEKGTTVMYFCFFPRDNMSSFPPLGVPYGVFAAPSSAWLDTGTVFTDDEDKNNADSTEGVPNQYNFGLLFSKIIYGEGESPYYSPFRGPNTYLLVAKVRD